MNTEHELRAERLRRKALEREWWRLREIERKYESVGYWAGWLLVLVLGGAALVPLLF